MLDGMVERDECPKRRIRETRVEVQRKTSNGRKQAVNGRIKGLNGGHQNRSRRSESLRRMAGVGPGVAVLDGGLMPDHRVW